MIFRRSTIPTTDSNHKWTFPARFRRNAFGWRSSKLAGQRIAEAVSEIKKVRRTDSILAAEGAVRLIEKISPALSGVNSSSGALGRAVNKAFDALLPIIIEAAVDRKRRERWLERLWDAVIDDDQCYLDRLVDKWGELCADPDIASSWANRFLETLRDHWSKYQTAPGHYGGTVPCLSCLLAARRHSELLDLLKSAPYLSWHYLQFGFRALVAEGRIEAALAYAQRLEGEPGVDQACEDLLLAQGAHELAYRRYAVTTNTANTRIATFRKISKKYPMVAETRILQDLIDSTPGEEGKWFATARQLGLLGLALDLARRSPCEPATLNRAAKETLEDSPEFAVNAALLSLHWLCQGAGYEVTSLDVIGAYRYAMEASKRLEKSEEILVLIKKMVSEDRSPGRFVETTLRYHLDNNI